MDPLERLPVILNRRSWLILGLLLLASLPLGSAPLTIGILAGGLVSIGGFLWLRRALKLLLAEPGPSAKVRYQFGYAIRLIVLASILAALVAVVKINPVGLMIGLSVTVINVFWTTIQRSLFD